MTVEEKNISQTNECLIFVFQGLGQSASHVGMIHLGRTQKIFEKLAFRSHTY